ncbi:MAG: IS21-like element helper ATPase IstB [Bacteroidales bacterium]
MQDLEMIKQYARSLKLSVLRNEPEDLLHKAQINRPSYMEFTRDLLKREVEKREQTKLKRRLKMARLPRNHDLDNYDHNFAGGITRSQLQQLRELVWLEQIYNLVLMGPSGIGKTYIAAGLVYDAVKAGYKAYFRSMGEIINILKMREVTSSAMNAYRRLLKANLIAIDDIMLFPIKRNEAVAFFNLINQLHEQCSIIITTNKSPQKWAETLEDDVLASALLDRLLFHCEVIKLSGKSYRMENRKTIFHGSEQEEK